MNTGTSDELVARAASGDAEAFDRLVREHQLLVYRWALVAADDPDDADDLVQAVWIKVHRHIGKYRGDSRFSSWLYRITFNTAVEFGRKRRRHALAMHAWRLIVGPEPAAVDQAGGIDAEQLIGIVRSFLGELAPRQRAVFALADLEDRSTAEIAEMLEIEEATVRVTLFKARRIIREQILKNVPHVREDHRK